MLVNIQVSDVLNVSFNTVYITQLSIPTHALLQRHSLKFIKNI